MKRTRAILIAITVLTLALCAALCASALSLYAEGLARRQASGSATEPIFTREGAARRLRPVCPLAALWLAVAAAAAVTGSLAPDRDTAAPRAGRPALTPMKGCPETPRRIALRAALYAAALLLLALGLFNGGLNDVLVKAVNICTECIGLG